MIASVTNANSIDIEKNELETYSSPINYIYVLNEGQKEQFFNTSISLSSPKIISTANSIKISLMEETSKTLLSNKPILPVVTQVYILPFKSKIKEINIFFDKEQVTKLSKAIKLAPEPLPTGKIPNSDKQIHHEQKDMKLFPEQHYSYSINSGRYRDKIVNYLTIRIYPVQYNATDNTIKSYNKANISFMFENHDAPVIFGNEYDLLILTPSIFSDDLKPLIEHKEGHGIRTKLITLNEILWGIKYPREGRDRAEKVKYFIKYALEEWGIKYVLLVGGRKGGFISPNWWFPTRYSNIVDFIEYSYLSDLYFADIYDSEGNFSSWDTDKDDIFGEWQSGQKDIIDMYPEVHVGRLPCKNTNEVKLMVEKIISYETTTYGKEWFNKFIGVAGDTHPKYGDSYYEGELVTEAAFNYLEEFESVFLWTSTGTLTEEQDIINHINEGSGFVMFSGHSDPFLWSTHPPENDSWIDAPNCYSMDCFENINKLPVIHVSGCWNAKFETGYLSLINGIIRDGIKYFIKTGMPTGYYSHDWVPKCWSWSLCSVENKGCIAITGNTGLGYGILGEECLSGKSNFMELKFFQSYSEGIDNLGEVHSNQIIKYMNEYPPMDDKIDCKLAQERTLLGDPSLKIGGYPPDL